MKFRTGPSAYATFYIGRGQWQPVKATGCNSWAKPATAYLLQRMNARDGEWVCGRRIAA